MNVLSLFDGISCGRIALEKSRLKVNNYFASEIDKNAIKVALENYPDTIELGDITKWKKWNLPKIDLLIGGSPCQGFSFSGIQLNFEDPRSRLFFEYVNILKYLKKKNPDIKFLLENVRMKKEYLDVISEYLGVEPIKINSSLVSAQNRTRYYWTNIQGVEQPEDKKIFLKDILDENYDGIYVIPRGYNKGGLQHYNGKSPTITTSNWEHNFYLYSYYEKELSRLLKSSKYSSNFKWKLDNQGKILCLRPDELKIQRIGRIATKNNHKTEIVTVMRQPHVWDGRNIRKVSPVEAERLQTLPENYTASISNNARYKAIGNGWTIDVISHIFSYMSE